MTHEQKPESAEKALEELLAQWPDENSEAFIEAREKLIADRKAGKVPMLKHFPEKGQRRITAAELIAEAQQRPESAEFRTRAEQIVMIMCEARYSDIIREKGLEELFDTILTEAEARGAAEQRRKDAEGAYGGWLPIETAPKDGTTILVPVKYIGADVVLWYLNGWRETSNMLLMRDPPTHWIPLPPFPSEGRPANVAALEARVKELEGEKHANEVAAFKRGFQGGRRDRYKQYARETAEAVAAERERCARIIEDHCEIMGGGSGKKLGPRSEGDKMALAYAAAIREGG